MFCILASCPIIIMVGHIYYIVIGVQINISGQLFSLSQCCIRMLSMSWRRVVMLTLQQSICQFVQSSSSFLELNLNWLLYPAGLPISYCMLFYSHSNEDNGCKSTSFRAVHSSFSIKSTRWTWWHGTALGFDLVKVISWMGHSWRRLEWRLERVEDLVDWSGSWLVGITSIHTNTKSPPYIVHP